MRPLPLPLRPAFRRLGLAALALLVTVAHLLLANDALDDALGGGFGAFGNGARDGRPRRIDVSFVRELAQAAPPLAAPVVAEPIARRVALAPEPPASSPKIAPKVADKIEPKPEPTPSTTLEPINAPAPPALQTEAATAAAPDPAPPIIETAAAVLPTPAPPNLTLPEAGPAPAFEWPPSTRFLPEIMLQRFTLSQF